MEIIESITYILPAILSLHTSVTVFYKNEKNMITFVVALVKSIVLITTCLYLTYLYLGRGQETRQTNIKYSLIFNYIALILTIITIIMLLKDNNFNKKLKKNINKVKNIVKNKEKKLI